MNPQLTPIYYLASQLMHGFRGVADVDMSVKSETWDVDRCRWMCGREIPFPVPETRYPMPTPRHARHGTTCCRCRCHHHHHRDCRRHRHINLPAGETTAYIPAFSPHSRLTACPYAACKIRGASLAYLRYLSHLIASCFRGACN